MKTTVIATLCLAFTAAGKQQRSEEVDGLASLLLAASPSAFQAPGPAAKARFDPLRLQQAGALQKLVQNPKAGTAMAALMGAAAALQAEAAHAIGGNQGQLDFGPLSGDQPGGEGTGKFLGVNDPKLFIVLFGVNFLIRGLFYEGAEQDTEATYAWNPDDKSGF